MKVFILQFYFILSATLSLSKSVATSFSKIKKSVKILWKKNAPETL